MVNISMSGEWNKLPIYNHLKNVFTHFPFWKFVIFNKTALLQFLWNIPPEWLLKSKKMVIKDSHLPKKNLLFASMIALQKLW